MLDKLKRNNKGEILLKKFEGSFPKKKPLESEKGDVVYGLSIDTETTGVDYDKDEIIEIGCVLFSYNKKTGEMYEEVMEYSSLNEPSFPIPEEASNVNNITDEMVKGQKIDWEKISKIFKKARIIIAHNAPFDRGMIEKYIKISKEKVWGCSLQQVDWKAEGFNKKDLEKLMLEHGFWFEAHRAVMDCKCVMKLLQMFDCNQKHYFRQLLEDASKNYVRVKAIGAPFEKKDLLKGRMYRWNPEGRYWCKDICSDDSEDERKWLSDEVYTGYKFNSPSSEFGKVERQIPAEFKTLKISERHIKESNVYL